MLTKYELDQIEHFKTENPVLKHLFDRIEQEHQYERFLITHNVRNPLTLMISSFPFLENSLPELNSSRHWSKCVNGAHGLRDFLDQLYEYYQSTNIQVQSFNLDSMLTNFVETLPCKACPHSVSVLLQLRDSCPKLNGDPKKLSHALKLLLQNSCEALPKETKKISIVVSQVESYCRIFISDSAQLFFTDPQPNFLLNDSFDYDYNTELKMYIANNIILAHGGYIQPIETETSSAESGLEIYLPLPL